MTRGRSGKAELAAACSRLTKSVATPHQMREGDLRARPIGPFLAIRYEDGQLQVTRQDKDEKVVLYQGSEDVRGKWMDFRFVTHFDSGAEGSVDAFLNGQEIVRYRGPTVFPPGPGYPRGGLVYFKMGLYRDALNEPPWTIYIDEYRKDQRSTSGCP
jgi:Polysaccharide lyase